MAKIKFVIDNEGNIVSEIEGIKGDKCVKVDRFLETLGDVKFTKTAGFYENEQPNDVNIVKQ